MVLVSEDQLLYRNLMQGSGIDCNRPSQFNSTQCNLTQLNTTTQLSISCWLSSVGVVLDGCCVGCQWLYRCVGRIVLSYCCIGRIVFDVIGVIEFQ
jgi:hypothetical protein